MRAPSRLTTALLPALRVAVLVVLGAPLEAVVNPPVLKWSANPVSPVGGCATTADPPGYYCETGWYASPAVADLNGDGQREVIWGGYDLSVLNGADGTELARAPSGDRIWPGVAVADLTGDGSLEILVGRNSDWLYAYRPSVAGSTWTLDTVWAAHPFGSGEVRTLAVEDLETDGQLEIVVGRGSGGDTEQLNVFEPDGSVRPGWPARHNGEPGNGWGMYNENVTVADMDGDGLKEIFGPTDTHYITALDRNGNQLPASAIYDDINPQGPKVWSQVGVHVDNSVDLIGYANCGVQHRPNFANSAPAVADVDGDGVREMIVVGNVYNCGTDPYTDLYYMPFILKLDRTRWSGSGFDWTAIPVPGPGSAPLSEDYDVIENAVPNPAIADLDGDGFKEILFPSYDGKLHAYWLDKTEHGSWPFVVPGSGIRFASEPVVADLDDDGQAEVIFTSWPEKVDGRLGQLHVLNSQGQPLYALDLPPAGADVSVNWNGGLGAPTISNIDGDPDLELVVGTVNAGVAAYDLPGSAGGRILWGTGRGNIRRTGALGLAPPASISDTVVSEGNAGTTLASFSVSLAFAASTTATVSYATANGSASAGADYVSSAGTLSFPPGITSRTLSVPVNGDLLDEDDETFVVSLSFPNGLVIGDGQGVGTILDDDPPPALSVSNAAAPEGSCAPSSAVFDVSLSAPSGRSITVSYATADGTAGAGVDYAPLSGTLTLVPGATLQPVGVPIVDDFLDEPAETFTLDLSLPTNATLADAQGLGTILDDDGPGAATPPELSHGSELQADLAAQPGPLPDVDVYALGQKPRSSYEAVVDALSGDVVPLVFERLSCAGGVAQAATPVGAGSSLALRFENTSAVPVNTQRLRVAGACGAACDAADVYRIRLRDTTLGIARFNNSGTQITLLVLQNPTAAPVTGHAWFRGASGAPLGNQPFSLAPRGTLTLNTTAVVPAGSGSVTVSHDGPYGALSGKTVAVEPATGFTFDTPLRVRER